jgi:hypothetical protein
MRALHVLFYKPEKGDHWLNHLVTFISPPYSHCDLQFENDIATSIYQNESVYIEKKNFTRCNYKRVSLSISDEEYNKILKFCENHHKNKTKFDIHGMLGCFLPFYNFKPKEKTFCSRYIVEALQESNIHELKLLNAPKISPSMLFFCLETLNKSFIHVSNSRVKYLTL